jgi:hypothetical protein
MLQVTTPDKAIRFPRAQITRLLASGIHHLTHQTTSTAPRTQPPTTSNVPSAPPIRLQTISTAPPTRLRTTSIVPPAQVTRPEFQVEVKSTRTAATTRPTSQLTTTHPVPQESLPSSPILSPDTTTNTYLLTRHHHTDPAHPPLTTAAAMLPPDFHHACASPRTRAKTDLPCPALPSQLTKSSKTPTSRAQSTSCALTA